MSLLKALNLSAPKAKAGPGAVPVAGTAARSMTSAAEPLPVASMPAAERKVEEIAAGIMDLQIVILVGWETALEVFDKTMSSSSDAEAKPAFQKVVVKHFAEKLMGALIKRAPGGAELDALVKALEGDIRRAATAKASATLRDFVVQHAKAIGQLHQAALKARQGFISAVRARREAVETSRAAIRVPKGSVAKPRPEDIALGALRIVLLDTFDSVERIANGSTSDALFRVLSEEWIRHATVYAGMGIHVKGVVIIRLKPDYSVLNAHIQGSGGQKLAEQLLKDSENGSVDVFRLKAQRRILLLAANGWPSVILNLDENNGDLSTGSYAEGDTTSLRKYVLSKGLPPTSNLTGD